VRVIAGIDNWWMRFLCAVISVSGQREARKTWGGEPHPARRPGRQPERCEGGLSEAYSGRARKRGGSPFSAIVGRANNTPSFPTS
jgi:hypothetical protein